MALPRSAAATTCEASALLGGGSISVLGPTGLGTWLHHFFSRLKTHLRNCVVSTAPSTDPTTASTQATGAAGVTVVRVNLPVLHVIVDGVQKEFAAEADRVLHDTTVYTGVDSTTLTSGKSAIIAIVAKNNAGTITLVNVKGGTATTGAQVTPTDAQIQTVVTGSLNWIRVAEVTINRTGDTTITQSQSHTCRPALGINIDDAFFGIDP